MQEYLYPGSSNFTEIFTGISLDDLALHPKIKERTYRKRDILLFYNCNNLTAHVGIFNVKLTTPCRSRSNNLWLIILFKLLKNYFARRTISKHQQFSC